MGWEGGMAAGREGPMEGGREGRREGGREAGRGVSVLVFSGIVFGPRRAARDLVFMIITLWHDLKS